MLRRLLLFSLLAALSSAQLGRAHAAPSLVDCSRIAYAAYGDDGSSDIYTIRPDGTGKQRLTDAPGSDFAPEWSPDGKQIAFLSERSLLDQNKGNSHPTFDVHIMDADGQNVKSLTNGGFVSASLHEYRSYKLAWSPDGQHILFQLQGSPLINSLNRLDSDWGFTEDVLDEDAQWLSWLPDGQHIGFTRIIPRKGSNGPGNIYVMDTEGKLRTRITNYEQGFAESPAWSPDGKQVAYSYTTTPRVDDVAGDNQIWVMNVDGTGLYQLTSGSETGLSPSWSPDGQQLIFSANVEGRIQIHVVELATKKTTLLLDEGSPQDTAWSPWLC